MINNAIVTSLTNLSLYDFFNIENRIPLDEMTEIKKGYDYRLFNPDSRVGIEFAEKDFEELFKIFSTFTENPKGIYMRKKIFLDSEKLQNKVSDRIDDEIYAELSDFKCYANLQLLIDNSSNSWSKWGSLRFIMTGKCQKNILESIYNTLRYVDYISVAHGITDEGGVDLRELHLLNLHPFGMKINSSFLDALIKNN